MAGGVNQICVLNECCHAELFDGHIQCRQITYSVSYILPSSDSELNCNIENNDHVFLSISDDLLIYRPDR